jgi:hypothetical protein
MRRWRGINSLLMGVLLLLGLTSYALAKPNTELTPPKLTGATQAGGTPEVEITVTGKLLRVMAIGGETTGWAVELDEPRQIEEAKVTRITIDPAGLLIAEFENRRVEIAGTLEQRCGVERGEYWVMVLKKIHGYPD